MNNRQSLMVSRARKRKNGKKPKETPKYKGPQITKSRMRMAISGTCGVKSHIARVLNVSVATVNKALRNWDDIRQFYEEECERVGDVAEVTIVDMMKQRLDYSIASKNARWWLERKHKDRGFKETKEVTLEGGVNPIKTQSLTIADLDLPLEVKRQILEAMEVAESKAAKEGE